MTLTTVSRRAALAAFVAALSPQAVRAQAVDRLGAPGPFAFGGASYGLSWSARPAPNYVKQEYLPAGQDKTRYDSMLLLEAVDGIGVPQALGAQARSLNARKGKDPLVNFAVIRNDKTGEAILDFVLGGRDAAGRPIAEWNGYRYVPRRPADGGVGVTLLGISRRAYGDDAIRTFLAGLKATRPGEIAALARQTVPPLRIGA